MPAAHACHRAVPARLPPVAGPAISASRAAAGVDASSSRGGCWRSTRSARSSAGHAHRQDRVHHRRARVAVEHHAGAIRDRPRRQQRDRRGLRQPGPDHLLRGLPAPRRRDGRSDAAGRASDQRDRARQRLGRRDVTPARGANSAVGPPTTTRTTARPPIRSTIASPTSTPAPKPPPRPITPNIPQAGFYPVYTWVLSSANRTRSALQDQPHRRADARCASITAWSAKAGSTSARTTSTPAARPSNVR